tara:strand:+ start:3255 stop:4625 length:1371 start_codon:yes stop_codon:yes gene_type:complete
MRPIGSEKLPVDQKLKRIMEIANYTRDGESTNNKNIEYTIRATNKKVYGIVRENSTYVIKEGKDVNSLEYIGGLRNSNNNRFKSYGSALKRLNLVISESNKISGNQKGLSLYGEQEEKFVLKTPDAPEAEEEEDTDDFDFSTDEEGDVGGVEDFTMDDETEEDEGAEEMDVDVEVSGEVEEGGPLPIKTIQKLTGKLGQKLREVEEDVDSDTIKYVLNSIISAVDITKLSAEDIEDIQEKLEVEDEVDYTEEGEFDVEITGDDEMEDDGDLDFSMDDEEIDLGESSMEGGEIPPVPEEDLDEIWPALRVAAGTAIGAKAGEWAGKKVFGEDEDFEDDVDAPGEEEDVELKSRLLDIFSESNENKVNKTIKKYFKETKQEKRRKKVIAENYIKNKSKRISNNNLAKKYFVSYEQEVGAKKLMETYNVDFLGRTKKGDLLFKKQNIKVGVTPQGKIIS